MLANAFDALNTYDWGTDLAVLAPIEEAVVRSHGDPKAATELEKSLISALEAKNLSRDAHDYVCRKLSQVGTAASVPALASHLNDAERAHMSRFALQRINDPAAGTALLDALSKLSGNLKIGVIASLGARGDAAAVAPLGKLLSDSDASIARAAALALGAIGNAESAAVLKSSLGKSSNQQDVIDALLCTAESLLAQGKGAGAIEIYKSLSDDKQPRLVRLAATRGILACEAAQA